MNQHRKLIFDKFYHWVIENEDSLPSEVTDITAEVWNLEEECNFWRNQYYKYREILKKNDMLQ